MPFFLGISWEYLEHLSGFVLFPFFLSFSCNHSPHSAALHLSLHGLCCPHHRTTHTLSNNACTLYGVCLYAAILRVSARGSKRLALISLFCSQELSKTLSAPSSKQKQVYVRRMANADINEPGVLRGGKTDRCTQKLTLHSLPRLLPLRLTWYPSRMHFAFAHLTICNHRHLFSFIIFFFTFLFHRCLRSLAPPARLSATIYDA